MTTAEDQRSGEQVEPRPLNLELLQSISLAVAEARDVETVLKAIVTGLADEASCTLVRIWLTAPGDICEQCALRAECPNRERCLKFDYPVFRVWPRMQTCNQKIHSRM